MILTNCAACAAPLAHDAPRCVRQNEDYCNKTWTSFICSGGVLQSDLPDGPLAPRPQAAARRYTDKKPTNRRQRRTCIYETYMHADKKRQGGRRGGRRRRLRPRVGFSTLAEHTKRAEGRRTVLLACDEASDASRKRARRTKLSLHGKDYHGAVLCALGLLGLAKLGGRIKRRRELLAYGGEAVPGCLHADGRDYATASISVRGCVVRRSRRRFCTTRPDPQEMQRRVVEGPRPMRR